jgi:hypothetical protein
MHAFNCSYYAYDFSIVFSGTRYSILRKIIYVLVAGILFLLFLELRGWFDSWLGQEISLFSTSSTPALKPTQPLIQWAPGALFLWG